MLFGRVRSVERANSESSGRAAATLSRIASHVLLLLLVATPASAGLGGYVEYGLVQYAANWIDDGFVQDGDQAHAMGIGVAWDSNLAADSLLNYRLNVGFRHLEPSEGDDDLRLEGLSAQFTLGFAPVRTESMRFWLGPSVGVSYLVCDSCAGADDKADVHQASLGLGPEFGVNFHLGSIFGAANWAHRTNRARDQKTIDRLRRKHAF